MEKKRSTPVGAFFCFRAFRYIHQTIEKHKQMKKNYKVFLIRTLDWIVFSIFVQLKNFIMPKIYKLYIIIYYTNNTKYLFFGTISAITTIRFRSGI